MNTAPIGTLVPWIEKPNSSSKKENVKILPDDGWILCDGGAQFCANGPFKGEKCEGTVKLQFSRTFLVEGGLYSNFIKNNDLSLSIWLTCSPAADSRQL